MQDLNVFWHYIMDSTADWLQAVNCLVLRHLQPISSWVYDVMSEDIAVLHIMNSESHNRIFKLKSFTLK